MKKRHFNQLLFALGFTIGLFSVCQAATNPTNPGTTSTGNLTINATVPSLVRISNVQDITFQPSDFLPNQNASAVASGGVCIYSNAASTYYITATSTNGGSTFLTKSSGNLTIPYTVTWYQTANATGSGTTLISGQKQGPFTGANNTDNTCASGSGNNANYQVSILNSSYTAVPAGTYTDSLVLVLTPQ